MKYVSIIALLGLLGCSHDAARENPLDPGLTPPVELAVAFDDTAGVAQLSWTRNTGTQPFGYYAVLRNAVGATMVDTLAIVTAVGDTSYSDSVLAPGVAYHYRVSIVNGGGLEVVSESQRVDGFQVRPVDGLSAAATAKRDAIALTWRAFRDPGFSEYRLFRRQVGTDADSLLAASTSRHDTSFTDLTALHKVDYLYRVVVQAAGRSLDSDGAIARLELPAVHIDATSFNAAAAIATARWSTYAGPRFAAYRVLRESPGQNPVPLAIVSQINDTTHVDTDLHGATTYTYRVEVVTTMGEQIEGTPGSGSFHHVMSVWDLPLQEGETARLYRQPEGVAALVAGPDHVSLHRYSSHGELTESVRLWESHGLRMAPQTVTYAPGENGEHILGLVTTTRAVATAHLLRLSASGQVNFDRAERLELDLDRQESSLGQRPALNFQRLNTSGTLDDTVHVSHVALTTNQMTEMEVFADGLSDWTFGGEFAFEANVGQLEESAGGAIYPIPGQSHTTARWLGRSAIAPFRFETVVRLGFPSRVDLQVDGESTAEQIRARVVLSLDIEPGFRVQRTRFAPTSSGGGSQTIESDYVPTREFPHRLSMEVDANEDVLIAEVGRPDFWSEPLAETPNTTSLGSVRVDGESRWVVTAGAQAFGVGEGFSVSTPGGAIAEQRYYDNGRQLAVCFAEDHQAVLTPARVSFIGSMSLPALTDGVTLSRGIGQEAGQMVFPISIDVGSDGRAYVLDAGNARIQVFDADGEYITQWGGAGSDAGQFDFGGGLTAADVAGSIAVDDAGFIYVADVGNRRIQKFAP